MFNDAHDLAFWLKSHAINGEIRGESQHDNQTT